MHGFSDFANWLIPDALLVGRYPYVEPSRCKSYEEGEQKLQQILKAGVTSFISLQVRRGVWCVGDLCVYATQAVCMSL